MATLTPADFKTKKPEFASIADLLIQEEIDFADLIICVDTWGKLYDRAFCLFVAHLLTLNPSTRPDTEEGDDGAGLVANSETVGDVSVSYDSSMITQFVGQNAGPISKELAMTSYGRQYKALRRRLGLTPGTTSGLRRVPPHR